MQAEASIEKKNLLAMGRCQKGLDGHVDCLLVFFWQLVQVGVNVHVAGWHWFGVRIAHAAHDVVLIAIQDMTHSHQCGGAWFSVRHIEKIGHAAAFYANQPTQIGLG